MDASLCSLSFFMILTLFQAFSFAQNDLTQVNPKISNQETLHRFVYQYQAASHKELATCCHWHTDWRRILVRQTIRQKIFLGGISLLPVLIQCICDLGQPRPVFDLFQQF